MDEMYLKMILALPEEFFDGWEWNDGDFYAGKVNVCPDDPLEFGSFSEDCTPNFKTFSGNYWYSKVWPLPRLDQLIKRYKIEKDIQFESLALLWLANWIEEKVTEDHSFCLKYRSDKVIALLWVQEKCFNQKWDGEKWT